jgi:hypothetical protein
MSSKVMDGYDNPEKYVQDDRIINSLVLFVFLIGIVLLVTTLQYNPQEVWVFSTMVFVIVLISMYSIHEGIHYVAYILFGYKPSFHIGWRKSFFGINSPYPYVVSLNQYLDRTTNAVSLIAPLFVVNGIALISFLPVMPPFVTFFGKLVLIFNTAGSMADVYNTIKVLRYPQGTLFKNMRTDGELETYYYLRV